jgi:hypothetical protein
MAEVEHLLEHHAAGKFEPERIELRPLPDGASGTMRAVYEFYGLVLSLRVDAGMDDPYEVLFAHRWVADKIGRPRETVQRALKRLVGAGVLEEPKTADAIPGKGPTHIYAPVPVRHLTALPDPKQDEIERRAA